MSEHRDRNATYEAPTRPVARRQMALVAVLVPLFVAAIQNAVAGAAAVAAATGGWAGALTDPVAVLLLALMATGWVVPVAHLVGGTRPSTAALGIAAVAVGVMALGPPPSQDPLVAPLAALALATALTPVLVALLQYLREWFAVGAGVGVALNAVARGWLGAKTPGTTPEGAAVLVVLALAGVVVWVLLHRRDGLPTLDRLAVSPAPLGVFLLAQATFLTSPHVVARWVVRPYVPLGVLAVVGALAGAWWVDRPHDLTRRAAVVWGAVLCGSLALLLWLDAVGMPFLLLGQAAAVVVLATGCRLGDRRGPWRTAALLVVAQLVATALVVLRLAALSLSPTPVIVRPLVAERGAAFLLALGVVLVAAVLATAPERPRLAPRYQRYSRDGS